MSEKAFCSLDNSDQIDYAQYWYQENPIPKLIVATKDYPPFMFYSAYTLVVAMSAYVLSMILARKTLTELKLKSNRVSSKIKSFQKQLARYSIYLTITQSSFRTLFAQSVFPLCGALLIITDQK
jgi:hypothetical protein